MLDVDVFYISSTLPYSLAAFSYIHMAVDICGDRSGMDRIEIWPLRGDQIIESLNHIDSRTIDSTN